MGAAILILATVWLCALRLIVPTVGHSWPMVFIAAAHIFVGVLLTLLWQRRGRWLMGWVCLGVPTALEAYLFFAVNGLPGGSH